MAIKRYIVTILTLLVCLHTANAGWTKQKTNSFAWFRDVFFINQQKGWIVGTDGTLLSTTDGGATWTQPFKTTTDTFLQIHFTDEYTGWILCERNIYSRGPNASSYLRKTTDGGRTWTKFEFEDSGRERVTRLLFNSWGSAIAFGEGGLFYKLQEDGETWKKSKTAIHFLLLDGAFGNREIGALSGAGGTIVFTENAGLTWEKATLMGDTDTRLNSIFYVGVKQAWAVGTNGVIYHATGGGRLWRQQDSGTHVNLNDVYFTTAEDGWAVGDDGIIVATHDGGKTWADGDSPATHKLERVTFVEDRGWAVGFGGTLLRYDPNSTILDTDGKPSLQKRN